jgi:fatty-acid desaturase
MIAAGTGADTCSCCTPCRTFSAKNALIGFLVYAIPGIFGITLCFHRMLTHRCGLFGCGGPLLR